MAKKVFLGVGHGGTDPGAVGYIREKDVNLSMALACRDYLEEHGVKVKMSRTKDEDDPLTEEIRECNAYDPDLCIDIHNNAGGGNGFEAYYSIGSTRGKQLAKNIEAEVLKIGQNSRGVKTRANSSGGDYYGFVRQTKAPAVICEGVFVDNKADAAQADTKAEQAKFGVAYAKGILKTLGMSAGGAVKPTPEPQKLKVDGSWGNACTKKSQQVFGTTVDGIVSNQPASNKKYLPNAYVGSWQFKSSGYQAGSSLIRAIQKLVGAEVDGWAGKEFVEKMQVFLKAKGFYKDQIDRSMGPNTVKGWQKYINSRL